MPHIYIDETPFNNIFAAIVYAAYNAPNSYPRFDLFESEFSKVNWQVEPTETFQQLMDNRAIQLREKYDRLVLMFSGGTDSLPIYKTFKRLNIHLDEIIIAYHKDPLVGHEPAMVEWIKKDLYDPTIMLTVKCRDELPAYLNTVKSGFLLEQNRLFWNQTCTSTGEIALDTIQSDRMLQPKSSAVVIGYEKPVVVFKDGRWWATAIDKTYKTMMHGFEYFYISPDLPALHVKQSHLLKRYAKQQIKPTTYWSSAEFSSKSWQNFDLYSLWCGREHNLSLNNAIYQKVHEMDRPFNIRAIVDKDWASINPRNRLHEFNTKNFEVASINKLFDELVSIQTDPKVMAYMRSNNLLPANGSVDNYNGVFSKFYDMGE